MSTAMLWDQDPLYRALTMIDLRRWSLQARIATEIRQLSLESGDGWARIGYKTMALRLRCSERYCHDLMAARDGRMWKVERVLVRGEIGKGTRGTAYRVNLNPGEWRNVPWIPDREVRRLTFQPVLRAPHRGSNDKVGPRSSIADLKPSNPPENDQNSGLDPRSLVADLGIARSAMLSRGSSPDPEPPSHLSSLNLRTTSTAEEEKEDAEHRTKVKIQIRAAVLTKTNGVLFGEPLERMIRMGCDDIAAVLAAIAAAPAGYGPPKVVDYVEARLASATRSPEVAARRVQILRALIDGDPDGDATEERRRELAACENDLAQFKAELAAAEEA